MRVSFHPDAEIELAAAQDWYQERSPLASIGFLREISSAILRIQEAPLRYPLTEPGTRRLNLERFPFTVHYRVSEGVILVVAVAHQRRRPRYWAKR